MGTSLSAHTQVLSCYYVSQLRTCINPGRTQTAPPAMLLWECACVNPVRQGVGTREWNDCMTLAKDERQRPPCAGSSGNKTATAMPVLPDEAAPLSASLESCSKQGRNCTGCPPALLATGTCPVSRAQKGCPAPLRPCLGWECLAVLHTGGVFLPLCCSQDRQRREH